LNSRRVKKKINPKIQENVEEENTHRKKFSLKKNGGCVCDSHFESQRGGEKIHIFSPQVI